MSNSKHPPGPWTFTLETKKKFDVDTGEPVDRSLIYIRDSNDCVFLAISAGRKNDAHLIAAAPEMLDCLERVISGSGLCERLDMPIIADIYKALDKARGKP